MDNWIGARAGFPPELEPYFFFLVFFAFFAFLAFFAMLLSSLVASPD
jgi:hypothetical protein